MKTLKSVRARNARSLPTRLALSSLIAFGASTGVPQVFADDLMEEVVVTGTRAKGRTAVDLPVAVDSLNVQALSNTGETELGRMLQQTAPSFNFSSSSISDGSDALRPATLRGLGPDQTLVLINGKRRHQASLIHINTSVGRGTAGTDMNAIPAAGVKSIEVLRDGAAAQYGSDAIAGVINILLDDSASVGQVSLSYGEYSEGDGETANLDLKKGFELGSSGFVNFGFNYRDRSSTNRAGLHGSCQFSGCTDTGNFDQNGQNIQLAGDPRELTAPRRTFRIGDADSEQIALTINSAIEVGGGELYGFLTYSARDNQSAAFFRHNANAGGNAQLQDGDATIPAGFLPKINTEIEDLSLSVGYEWTLASDATMNVSYTTGENSIDYRTSDSINSSFANFLRYNDGLTAAQVRTAIPREAKAYGLELALSTINFDYTQEIGDLALAAGLELRTDEYRIIAGDEYAYRDFDTVNGVSIFNGLSGGVGSENASGGIQGFPGIGPVSAVDEERDVFSAFVDAEYQLTEALLLTGALRYDDYDDFGNTVNFKLGGNLVLTDTVRLRSAVSTGFRAPSMQQLYFNNVSTQFVNDPANPTGPQIAQQVGTFRNDSSLATSVGIPELKEEESTNLSFGVILDLLDNLSLTVDYYSIDIDDRIVISNRLGTGLSTDLDAALLAAGAGKGQFFLNGADTETTGFDVVATYSGIELASGNLDVTLAANFTETEVVRLFTPQGSNLANVAVSDVFSTQDISIIEEWQPEDRIALTGNWNADNLSVNLTLNRYGEYTVTDGGRQTYGAEILTDLSASYQMGDVRLTVGGNNIFDVTPDENTIGNSRTGTIVDGAGSVVVSSPGVFTYSRRSAPFGFNGAYYFAKLTYDF